MEKMQLTDDFKEFVALLNENKVEYMIVGGYAVSFYGYPRTTGDMDVWIKVSEKNADNVLIVLKEFGLGSLPITKDDLLDKDAGIQLGYPPLRIDIITSLTALEFDICYENKKKADINGIYAYIIGLDCLKINKKALNRYRDLDDLENLG